MLLKSLPLLGALFGFLVPGSYVNSAPNLNQPIIFEVGDLDCMCLSELTSNVVTAAPLCPQQQDHGIVFVPCFYTEYLTTGAGENGECPEKVGCLEKKCKFPDIQFLINWQFDAEHLNDGCIDSDDCCSTGVGYAGSTQLQAPDDVMNGAGSYKYLPWRRNITADCGSNALADWAGVKCDGRSDNDPWDYYMEFWFECKKCPLNAL
jgi:hypothetical protein